MDIAIPIFDGLTVLDAVGPYEVLSALPGVAVRFLAAEPGPKRSANGMLALTADLALDQLTDPEIIVVPGGPGTWALFEDEQTLRWLRRAHGTSTWTTSVCTGSLLLAAAGLLDGLEATTHWTALEELRRFGAQPVKRRVVELPEQRIITSAGVSAGIDMALGLAARLAGEEVAQAVQLNLEYDPEPPFQAGSPDKAPPEVVARFGPRPARAEPA